MFATKVLPNDCGSINFVNSNPAVTGWKLEAFQAYGVWNNLKCYKFNTGYIKLKVFANEETSICNAYEVCSKNTRTV